MNKLTQQYVLLTVRALKSFFFVERMGRILRSNAVVELLDRDSVLLTVVVLMDRIRFIERGRAIPTSTRASDRGILAGRNSCSLSLAKVGKGAKMLKSIRRKKNDIQVQIRRESCR